MDFSDHVIQAHIKMMFTSRTSLWKTPHTSCLLEALLYQTHFTLYNIYRPNIFTIQMRRLLNKIRNVIHVQINKITRHKMQSKWING